MKAARKNMCPFCIATAALVTASVAGTGGLAALVTGKLMKRTAEKDFPERTNAREGEHGHDYNEPEDF
jgi:hypothetical protein